MGSEMCIRDRDKLDFEKAESNRNIVEQRYNQFVQGVADEMKKYEHCRKYQNEINVHI